MPSAVVIPFPKISAPGLPATGDVNGPAQIIILQGVRYLHAQEDAEDLFAIATAPLKSTSKRKK